MDKAAVDGADVDTTTPNGGYNASGFWTTALGFVFGSNEGNPWKTVGSAPPKLWFE